MPTFETLGHVIDFEVREPGAGEAWSDAGAPTVALVHGLAGDRAILVESLDAVLARRGVRRLYLDLPGHGRSTGNANAAGADELVYALKTMLQLTVGGGPLLVLGYSYGAYLSLGLARDLEPLGLCLVCPVVEAELGKRTRPPRHVVRRDEPLVFVDDPHERLTFEEVAVIQTEPLLAAYRRLVYPASIACDRPFIDAVRTRYAMSQPYVDALARFPGSVAIVCGRHDHWVGFSDAASLARTFSDVSLHVMPRAGQLLPLEAPAALAAAVEEWLDRALAVPPQGEGSSGLPAKPPGAVSKG